MRKIIIISLLIASLAEALEAQEGSPLRTSSPLVLSLHFHALSLPFKNMGANFKNVGIGIGTEIAYANNPQCLQSFTLIWYRNRTLGNGFLIKSQAIWRPTFGDQAFGEIKLGLGYLLSRRPVRSLVSKNGKWLSAKKRGKGMWTIPMGAGLGFNVFTDDQQWSPFVNYEFLLVTGYNKSVPLAPQTLISLGKRLYFE